MPDTITFESLGEAYTDDIDAALELPISINAVVADGVTELVFALCTIPISTGAGAGVEAPDVDTIQAELEIPIAMGFTAAYEVGTCEAGLDLAITVSSYVAVDTVGELTLPLTIEFEEGASYVPVADEPFVEIEEAFLGTTTNEVRETLAVLEGLMGQDAALALINRMALATETMTLRTKLTLVIEALGVDEMAFAEIVAGNPLVTIALVDALQLAGAAQGSVAAMAILSDVVALATAVASIQEAEADDAAAIEETVQGMVSALESVVSTAVFSEVAQGLAVVTVLVPETMDMDAAIDMQAIRLAAVHDNLPLAVSFDFDGVPYVGLSMNASTKGITEYDAYDYNSQASFNGKFYTAGAAGLYRHDSDTDAGTPIAAYLRTAMNRVAGGKNVRISDAYLGFRGTGAPQLKVVVTNADGQKISYVYDLDRTPSGAQQAGRFKVGRGLKSVYMAFELSNATGGEFAVDVLEIRPLVLDRRLP